jgi:TolB protein
MVLADPPVSHELARLVTLLRENLGRSNTFMTGGSPTATLRVGARRATLYLPPGVPGGPLERRFELIDDSDARPRVLASDLHRFYTGDPGPYRTRIAFISGTAAAPKSRHVFTINFDSTGIRRVSDDNHPNLLPAWSRRGDLVYTSFINGGPLLVLQPAGQSGRRLLGQGRDLNTGPAFSPDGRTLAVSQSVDGNTDIYLLDRNGVVQRRVTTHRGIDISPSFSPSGAELAFVSDRGGSPQVHLVSLASGEIRQLTSSGFYNQEPSWCPRSGSRQIAYTHRYSGSRYEVHLLDADTGQSTRLTHSGGQNTSPSWSPDCKLLVYTTGDALWIITPRGTHPRKIHDGRARSPAWSPRLL